MRVTFRQDCRLTPNGLVGASAITKLVRVAIYFSHARDLISNDFTFILRGSARDAPARRRRRLEIDATVPEQMDVRLIKKSITGQRKSGTR